MTYVKGNGKINGSTLRRDGTTPDAKTTAQRVRALLDAGEPIEQGTGTIYHERWDDDIRATDIRSDRHAIEEEIFTAGANARRADLQGQGKGRGGMAETDATGAPTEA